MESSQARYDFETIDLESNSTHADVVRLVGNDKRVLELGPATGYMSSALARQGCSVVGIEIDPQMAQEAAPRLDRVIVGDLEQLDLQTELAAERFDVVLAADVLEHLRDPLGALRRLTPFLREAGAFVLSVPNVAHGSVRLALLGGEFEYQELGLLDRTHLRFFTRATLERMLDEAELGVAVMHRHELDLDASEVPFPVDTLTADLRARLEADRDARTYQFVVKALPLTRPGLRDVQRRLRELALARGDAERECVTAKAETERLRAALDEAQTALAQISAREGELRGALIDAHDQLLRLQGAESERNRLAELRRGDRAWIDEQAAALAKQGEELAQARRALQALRSRRALRAADLGKALMQSGQRNLRPRG